MASRARQMGLFERSAGSKRARKAGHARGPKPRAERKGFVAHGSRPAHDSRHPVHVTMRRVRNAPSFRRQVIFATVLAEMAAAKRKGVRIVHHSVQDDHLHLMIEGEHREDLAKQMCRLFSRIAMAINRVAQRTGPLFRDRHHRRALETPTEVRNALVYILFNIRKHSAARLGAPARGLLDACSSAPWFSDWDEAARPPPEAVELSREYSTATITSEPRTWLARAGWRRGGRRGPLRFDEQPRTAL